MNLVRLLPNPVFKHSSSLNLPMQNKNLNIFSSGSNTPSNELLTKITSSLKAANKTLSPSSLNATLALTKSNPESSYKAKKIVTDGKGKKVQIDVSSTSFNETLNAVLVQTLSSPIARTQNVTHISPRSHTPTHQRPQTQTNPKSPRSNKALNYSVSSIAGTYSNAQDYPSPKKSAFSNVQDSSPQKSTFSNTQEGSPKKTPFSLNLRLENVETSESPNKSKHRPQPSTHLLASMRTMSKTMQLSCPKGENMRDSIILSEPNSPVKCEAKALRINEAKISENSEDKSQYSNIKRIDITKPLIDINNTPRKQETLPVSFSTFYRVVKRNLSSKLQENPVRFTNTTNIFTLKENNSKLF